MNVLGTLFCLAIVQQESHLEYLEPQDSSGTSKAVVVRDTALAYTAQMFPFDKNGDLVGKGDEARQIESVLDSVSTALQEVGSDLDRTVRIHVYASAPEMVDLVKKAFSRRFGGRAKPAATFVSVSLPYPGAIVAMDAVAAVPPGDGLRRGSSRVAVLPVGPVVFISGQAGNGELTNATRKTLEGLQSTLEHLGLTWSDVVQIKTFLKPIAAVDQVEKEIKRLCGAARIPPLVFVEWQLETPIEIELVASGGKPSGESKEAIRFITPPGMKASPVFSLVTRVERGGLLFTSGIYGSGDSEAQVREIFGTVRELLGKAGSDFGHLAKATYYITDEATSGKLAQVRKEIYDPARPPAASKASVRGVGVEGKTITLDLIGVTPP
ncbi:MAG TPA: Rid family hydrolase [Planctomycetota bacterium]|nr:Rid family hydrolase [Planctomycetota bacterium]